MASYLLLDHTGVIMHVSPDIGHQNNGNPLVDHGTLAYAAILVDRVVEVGSIPEGMSEGATDRRYCYIDGEFVPNPNWVEPTPEPDVTGALDEAMSILTGKTEV